MISCNSSRPPNEGLRAANSINLKSEFRVSVATKLKFNAIYNDAFEPFNRLGAESGGVEGSGIGLAIAVRAARDGGQA